MAAGLKPVHLRRIMKEERVTQEMLAEWTGIHVNTIGNWARGKTEPKMALIVKVAKVLRRDVSEFYEKR